MSLNMSLQHHLNTKPPIGDGIDWSHELAAGLSSVILAHGSLRELDLVTRVMTIPAATSPALEAVALPFGAGWRNTAVSNKLIDTNYPRGYFQGLSRFSLMLLASVVNTPGGSAEDDYFAEPVNDVGTGIRVKAYVGNGVDGMTGIKWGFSFRTGNSASTQRDVNAGAGGTTVGAGNWIVAATFDADVDDFRLYVSGRLEATLSVAESAMEATDPFATPKFLGLQGGGPAADGRVHGQYIWANRVLSPAEVTALSLEPYAFFLPPPARRWGIPAGVPGVLPPLFGRHTDPVAPHEPHALARM